MIDDEGYFPEGAVGSLAKGVEGLLDEQTLDYIGCFGGIPFPEVVDGSSCIELGVPVATVSADTAENRPRLISIIIN